MEADFVDITQSAFSFYFSAQIRNIAASFLGPLAHPDSYREVRAPRQCRGMPSCYILESRVSDQFYIGSTALDLGDRLAQHNSAHFKNSFTAKSDDWQIVLEIPCVSIRQARLVEAHIKRMKSRKYITNLKAYPEMVDKLLSRYAE